MEGGGGGAEEEQVMSEVHLGCPPHFSGLHVSRFSFSSRPLGVSGDDDGDGSGGSELVAATSCSFRSDYHLLTIQHGVTSSLKSVGLQVWKAALLLADFVLHKSFTSSNFDGVTAIEVGAGTGLVGLALARVARRIFVTVSSVLTKFIYQSADRGADILDNCLANVHINSGMLKFDEAKVCVRELDWKMSWPPPVCTYDPSDPRDAVDRDQPGLVGKQIDLAEVPQYIREYERGKDLEIWEIMYSPEQKLQ
ncbi:hypothetical protein BAE44_0002977 [Dichanthelium oligosanthes]|uniref:Methyltransferase-like protein 22 n=1 Tax=Dichanthelium oligosanthes TaxID=888268 RepID=A0A1E5WF94_9POAL|nr:hypothetical protein BAE44_0002977 [Dichanthelium oligosanthes]